MGNRYTGVTALNKSKTLWQYRIKMTLPSGEKIDTISRRDENGMPYATAESAFIAREKARQALISKGTEEAEKRAKMTLSEVYESYKQSHEAKMRAPATLRKQESMWSNYVGAEFGGKLIGNISLNDLNAFLSHLYYDLNKSYSYTQGFLRFFYLLFGFADRCDLLDTVRYTKMFVNKSTHLKMPDRKQTANDDDGTDEEIVVFSDDELKKIEPVFLEGDGNLLCAYYLGLKAGLRISEVFALRWRNIDFDSHTITINRQLHYENNQWQLCPVKTLTSIRKILMPLSLENFLCHLKQAQEYEQETRGIGYRNTERVYDTITKEVIQGGDFINRKKNGELLTNNSMKYYSKKIKNELHIDFKFHYLRHTYATLCAYNNVNLQILMNQMGHKKIDTTRKYYLGLLNNQEIMAGAHNLLSSVFA